MSFEYPGLYNDVLVSASNGRPLRLTPFTVYDSDGTTVSTIYSTRTRTAAANPNMTDDYGNASFYAEPGRYYISVSGSMELVVVPPDAQELDAVAWGWPGTPRARVTGGGAMCYGIPGMIVGSQSTQALTQARDHYWPFVVSGLITVDSIQAEVTTSGGGNMRLGIYRADADLQPSGAPLFDSGNIAVSVAVKTAAVPNLSLRRGLYLFALNHSASSTFRVYRGGGLASAAMLNPALGANALASNFRVARAYAAFPTPGTPWDTVDYSTVGIDCPVVLRWTPVTAV